MLTTSGEALFARYAFPPNDLGHCGPPGADLLLTGGASGHADSELRARAALFDGAWPYLRLLAGVAGVDDPLDAAVVSAYWLGSDLLDKVDADKLVEAVDVGFRHQPGVRERLVEMPGLDAARASHAFHVFVVYPWVGLLGSGSDVPRAVLDSCRVRWGTVESVDGETAGVRTRPLRWDGTSLALGAERLETCRWTQGRQAFVHDLVPGDQVALHWDWVCDRLTDDDLRELSGRTLHQLELTNAWLYGRR